MLNLAEISAEIVRYFRKTQIYLKKSFDWLKYSQEKYINVSHVN